MVQVIAEVTWSCPCRCKFCNIPKSGKTMPVSDFRRILEAFRDFFDDSDNAVVISGGEPATLAFLRDYVVTAKELGYTVTVVTSGWHPDRVMRAEPDVIEVSVDYFGRAHDVSRGVDGLFNRAMNLIATAVRRGLYPVVRSTAMKDNIMDIIRLREHLDRSGLTEVPVLVMPVRGAPHLKPTEQQLRMLKRDMIFLSDNCPAGKSSFVVTPEREILACIFYRKKLGELWRFTAEEVQEAYIRGTKLPLYPCESTVNSP